MTDSDLTAATQNPIDWSGLSQNHTLTLEQLVRLDPSKTDMYLSILPTLAYKDLLLISTTTPDVEASHPAASRISELAEAWGSVSDILVDFHHTHEEATPNEIEDRVLELYRCVYMRQTGGAELSEAESQLYSKKAKSFALHAKKTIIG